MSTVISQAGFEVWFKPGRAADPTSLINGLSNISSSPPYVPEKRSKLESLQLSLTDVMREKSHDPYIYVVRTLAGRSGRHVFLEIRGAEENEMKSRFVVHTPQDNTLIPEGEYLPKEQTLAEIQGKYEHYLDTLGHKAVKTILVKEIYRLGGIKIDGKDAYFLPPEKMDQWRLITNVVRSATVSQDAVFYEQEYRMDGSALEAVQVSVEEEIVTETEKMLAELAQGEYTDRVAKNRLEKLKSLASKMERYEKLFNSGLTTCQERIGDVLQAMSLGTAAEDSQDVFDEALNLAI